MHIKIGLLIVFIQCVPMNWVKGSEKQFYGGFMMHSNGKRDEERVLKVLAKFKPIIHLNKMFSSLLKT